MGFAYCDFRHQGAAQMLMARAVARPRSLHPPEPTRSADASRTEVSRASRRRMVESAKIEPVKSEAEARAGETGKRSGTAPLDRLIAVGVPDDGYHAAGAVVLRADEFTSW